MGGQYLYYWSATQWQIGSDYLEGNSGVQSVNGKGSPCPLPTTAYADMPAPTIWQVATSSGWSALRVDILDVAVISVTQLPNVTATSLAFNATTSYAALVFA